MEDVFVETAHTLGYAFFDKTSHQLKSNKIRSGYRNRQPTLFGFTQPTLLTRSDGVSKVDHQASAENLIGAGDDLAGSREWRDFSVFHSSENVVELQTRV